MKAHGVIVLRAKKRQKGRMPSFASSCFTSAEIGDVSVGLESFSWGKLQKSSFQRELKTRTAIKTRAAPLEAVNVITTTFPKIENAMIADITRGATRGPKIAPKKTVAMSSLQSA